MQKTVRTLLICLFLSLFFVACATKSSQEGNNTVLVSSSVNAQSPKNQVTILDYYSVLKNEHFKFLKEKTFGENFKAKDIKNGYIHVTGAMEGGYIFALFKGINKDLVLVDSYGCGPVCTHQISAYVFNNLMKYEVISFAGLFAEKELAKHINDKKLEVYKMFKSAVWTDEENFFFELPRSGRQVNLLIEKDVTIKKGQPNELKYFNIGHLEWIPKTFSFKEHLKQKIQPAKYNY